MTSRSQFLAVLAVGTMLGLSSGCTTVNTVEPAQPAAQREMLSDKRVITDTTLAKRVRVLGINTATSPAGFLKIQIEVQNATNTRKSFTYRIEWFDEKAMIINSAITGATPVSLEGKETKSITATAPNPAAKDFRIKFLEPAN